MRSWSLALALSVPFSAQAEDYMRMLQPYQESAEDKEVLQQLQRIDAALTQRKDTDLQTALQRLHAIPTARKSLEGLIKSQTAMTRALAAMGFRLLPIKRGFKDKLQYLLMDAEPAVRRQVLLYVQQEPDGVDLKQVQLTISDGAAMVRIASVGAIVKTAKKPDLAASVLKQRLLQEQDPAVVRAIKIGFTALGLPTPDLSKEKRP